MRAKEGLCEPEKGNRRSLHYAALRSKNISTKGPRNCRSLGFARDDKERATVHREWLLDRGAFFITLGGPQAQDSSGLDDNSIWDRTPRFQEKYEVLAATELSSRPERNRERDF
jgi:hypothetical protein